MTVDLDALSKSKPLFVYYYVALTKDRVGDPNFQFASKFEQGTLGQETIEFLNKNFICKRVEIPMDADLKVAKNHARLEIYSQLGKKMGLIGIENDASLNKSQFLGFLQVRITKCQKVVADEVARIQKVRKDKELADKKQAAKKGE